MDDLEDYHYFDAENDFYDDSQEFEEYGDENFSDVWNNCFLLSIQSILPLIWRLIFTNLSFGILISSVKISEHTYHILSGLIGIYLATEVQSGKGKYILVIYFLVSYLLIVAIHYIHKRYQKNFGALMKVGFIASLILSEHLLIENEVFIHIRGILMIFVMKILHLVDETLEKGKRPQFLQYFGYTLCGANILFGPWCTYQDYHNLHSDPKKKNIYWIFGILKSLALSILCLSVSNCWASYFVSDSSNRWLLAYRDAFAFRYSHYFVCYLSEMSMISAGFKNFKLGDNLWSYPVASPLEVELPTSLSAVVTKWNQPMHLFLKKTIYLPMQKYGQFSAVMATFLVSSFLHGMEVRVSVILLSLGLFSYLQVKSRILISDAMNACLNVKPCKQCNHKYNREHFVMKVILFLYSLDSILHLAYLGILMDPSSSDVSFFEQWRDLYFVSHIIMFVNLLLII